MELLWNAASQGHALLQELDDEKPRGRAANAEMLEGDAAGAEATPQQQQSDAPRGSAPGLLSWAGSAATKAQRLVAEEAPTGAGTGRTGLEASLEGAAERIFSWASAAASVAPVALSSKPSPGQKEVLSTAAWHGDDSEDDSASEDGHASGDDHIPRQDPVPNDDHEDPALDQSDSSEVAAAASEASAVAGASNATAAPAEQKPQSAPAVAAVQATSESGNPDSPEHSPSALSQVPQAPPERGAEEAAAAGMGPSSLPASTNAAEEPQKEAARKIGAAGDASGQRKELGELRAELEDLRGQLRHRDARVQQLSNSLAQQEEKAEERQRQAEAASAKARRAAEKDLGSLQKRLEAAEAAQRDAVQSAETWKERATLAERRQKQDAADTEKELLQAQELWRKKISAAEARTEEVEREAEGEVAAVAAERDTALAQVEQLRSELAAQTELHSSSQRDAQASSAQAQGECKQLLERLQASVATEMQLRQEVLRLEDQRASLQERCAELTQQLASAQAAYGEAATEVGALSSRLDELEFRSRSENNSEELLWQQLHAEKAHRENLEAQLRAANSMKDLAQQQAEEARSQVEHLREELKVATASCASASKGLQESAEGATSGDKMENVKAEVDALRSQLAQQQQQKEEEVGHLQQEVQYLRQKNDEKSRRIELLTCERNTFRLESADGKHKAGRASEKSSADVGDSSAADLAEAGGRAAAARRSGRGVESAEGGVLQACLLDADVVLRGFSNFLSASPIARRTFYGYVLVLHVWIWVVIHRAAAAHSPHGS